MEILSEYPPNFDKISAALPGAHKEGVIFAYYPYVYKPHGDPEIRPELVAHEQVHLNRQAEGDGPEQWWDEYISNAAFRFEEEKLAHIVEAKSLVNQASDCRRATRRRIATWIGGRLAAPLYKSTSSKRECIKLIMASL